MTAALLVAAFSCAGAAAVADIVTGTRRGARALPYVLAGVASLAFLSVGIRAVATGGSVLRLGNLFGFSNTTFRIDGLAGMFMTLCFAIAAAVSACTITWSRRDARARPGLGVAYSVCLASVAAIVLSGDAFVFLFAWEALTVSFYVMAGVDRPREGARAPWLTLVTGKVSGACLLVGFLLLSASSGSLALSSWHASHGAAHDWGYALLVVGFAAKLGVVPLQAWIPPGYRAAPGPARALMAGVAMNVGAYGLWRTLALLGRPPVWLVVAVLLLGGATAVLGIAFAGVETRLGRVLAYSSVENAGIIIAGFGIALAGARAGQATLEVLGLLAASLQVIAHAIAKSLLFCAAATVEQTLGHDDLDSVRGIGRAMPATGVAFGAGALVLAGLPPTIGFVSEWFVLEALMQEFRLSGLALRLAMAGAGALIALTAGLAALAFLRILGLVFLGRPGARVPARADGGLLGRFGMAALGLACFGLAAATPWEIRFVARGLEPIASSHVVEQALKSPWVLQPSYAGFSILSPSWLYVVMPVASVGVIVLVSLVSSGRYLRVRRVPVWRSATPGVAGPSSYSAFGFANALRHVLANVLGTRREQRLSTTRLDAIRGRGPVEYVTNVIEPVEAYVYRPIRVAVLRVARVARMLQSGRVQAYVAYMLFALVVALAITASLN